MQYLAIALTIEVRDPCTAGHQCIQASYAISSEPGLFLEQIKGIRVAVIVHDIDKFYVCLEILKKQSRLRG